MLPFQKPKRAVGIIINNRKPDGEIQESDRVEGEESPALEACAEDIMRAISNKDSKALASALRSAMQCMDMDAPGSEDESYDAQNQKAAEKE